MSEVHDAQERVTERNAALQLRAERALAYARIYAADDQALSARVAEIRGPAASAAQPAAKKRGRPRKGETDDKQLDVLDTAAE